MSVSGKTSPDAEDPVASHRDWTAAVETDDGASAIPVTEEARVLVVTSGAERDRVEKWLARDGFAVSSITSRAAAVRRLETDPADVIVARCGLDASSGRFVQEVRAASPEAALVLLASDDAEAEAVRKSYPESQEQLVLADLGAYSLRRMILRALDHHHRLRDLEQRVRKLEGRESGFRSIITTTADGIVIVDRHDDVRFVNPAAERLFGREASEMIGTPFEYPLVSGQTSVVDVVRPDGDALAAELRVADTDWQGGAARLVSLRDVTQRRREEEQARQLIREQVARAEALAAERSARFVGEVSSILAESLEDPSTLQRVAARSVPFLGEWCVIDLVQRDGSLQRAAVAYADPAHQELAHMIRDVGPDLERPCGVGIALQQGENARPGVVDPEIIGSIARDEPVVRQLLSLGYATVLFAPLRTQHRTFGCMTWLASSPGRYGPYEVGLVEETARRVAVAIDNARLYREVQDANRTKADFLAVMSHELRTPLNAVIGYSDLLLLGVQSKLSGNAREYVERIRSSARHLLLLIDEILTFARAEAGREPIRSESVMLSDLVREVSALTELLALEKGIAYRLHAADGVILETDPGKVRQILVNLLSNAVKFTDEGVVELHVFHDDTTVEFEVRDSGPGIRPEHLEVIFEPFWQAEQSHARRLEGTGLGLAVARRLTRLLGGEIRVESKLGHGTAFTIRLPRRQPPGH